MIHAEQLLGSFQANHSLAGRHTADLSHPESLLNPGFQANSMNWILGHIINARNEALDYLGHPGVWPGGEGERYRTGSEPINAETALPLEDLLDSLARSQAALIASFEAVDEATLQEVVETSFGDRPRWQHLSGLGWHETYHIGQLELLRQLALDLRAEPETGA